MSTWKQEQAWLAQWRKDGRPEWRHKFIRTTTFRCRCRECGALGLSGGPEPLPWQIGCLIGHRDKCEYCGAPTHRLSQHQSCKISSHVGCCQHTNTQYRELQKLLVKEKEGQMADNLEDWVGRVARFVSEMKALGVPVATAEVVTEDGMRITVTVSDKDYSEDDDDDD